MVERAAFCSVDDVLKDRPGNTKGWKCDGWVYQRNPSGLERWLHENRKHEEKIPWWNIARHVKYRRNVYLGYSKVEDSKCVWCEREIPISVVRKVKNALKEDGVADENSMLFKSS